MVAGLSPAQALHDVFFAAGLGFWLCIAYSAARGVLGRSRAACFVCDALVLVVGAVCYRSAALSFFYAGVTRWYTLAACTGSFLVCRGALAPLVERIASVLHRALSAPARAAKKTLSRVVNRWRQTMLKRREKKRNKQQICKKKRLQNAHKVLYNSK